MLRRRRKPAHRRWIEWWIYWRVPVLVLILLAGWYLLYRPLAAEGEWVTVSARFDTCGERGRARACVSDGDTVTIGYGASARRIRLVGYDAPEIEGACPAESALALRAQDRLKAWLNAGPFEWSGGTGPARDRYGRELRAARRALPDGTSESLADHMIAAGLAEGRGPWQRRNWCS